jgi:hypothetical protein
MLVLPRDAPLSAIAQDTSLRVGSLHGLLPWDAHPYALEFSRLVLASRDRYTLHLRSEMAALDTAIREARDWQSPEEIPYLEAAKMMIMASMGRDLVDCFNSSMMVIGKNPNGYRTVDSKYGTCIPSYTKDLAK